MDGLEELIEAALVVRAPLVNSFEHFDGDFGLELFFRSFDLIYFLLFFRLTLVLSHVFIKYTLYF